MSLARAFNNKKTVFIPFVMAGHPTISIDPIMALIRAGGDIIEVGVPFSDPSADGPVNQRAAGIALKNGMNLAKLLDQVAEIRRKGCNTPIMFLTYLNPILAFDYARFASEAKKSGVDAVLIVDLPPEEGREIFHEFKKVGLGIVLLASPTTEKSRYHLYKEIAPDFVYYISRLSVTGMQSSLTSTLEQEVRDFKNDLGGVKVCVGFGISTPEQASQVSKFADGVIVGSVIVKTIEEKGIAEMEKLAGVLAGAAHS